jgi:phospholipase C
MKGLTSLARRSALVAIAVAAIGSIAASGASAGRGDDQLSKINHIVVIYEENHSFDNLYGRWEGVDGLANADAAHTIQVGQGGVPYTCLLQNDVNLTSPPLPADCADTTTATPFASHFTNLPFPIEAYIPAGARTCPQPGVFAPNGLPPSPANLPGGCTRDIVHRFYQEQYQLNDGQQNRYTTGSDAVGLTQGYYDTQALPIYAYLHGGDHSHYAIADNFFESAFGGSFLNHQWLIAAATPTWAGAPASQHSIIDANGMPNNYRLYHATGPVRDSALTQICPSLVPGRACGDYAVNTIQPAFQPTSSNPTKLPPQTGTTIGDELSSAGVSWAWYAGGWSNAAGDVGAPGWTNGAVPGVCADPQSSPNPVWPYCPNKVFQFHHQPFNYYANYAPGTAGRTHLRDEAEFLTAAARKRASRLHERRPRQRPSRAAAAGDPGKRLREGHDGRRHLRRVRRTVGSRLAARPGRNDWAARPMGPGDANSGADRLAVPAWQLRRRPRAVRHDVDPRNDRTPLRARSAVDA